MATDPDLAPEAHNTEQDDEGAQAHTVASDAATLRGDPTASVKPDTTEVPDLVDHMRDMETTGRIDMSAFEGEPNMDDEDETYGAGHDPDET